MSRLAIDPGTLWTIIENVVESFHFFKQRCELHFSVQNIPEEKQVEHILIISCEEGLRRFNSWKFENQSDKLNPAVVWEKFLETFRVPKNFRIARFCLQKYILKDSENNDDFLARCRLQAKKCKFRDEKKRRSD